jgi:hypothetical protein
MNGSEHNAGGEENLDAPEKLVAALKSLPQPRLFIPPTLDEAILKEARRRISPTVKRPLAGWGWWVRWAAVTAAMVLLVGLAWQWNQGSRGSSFAREDLNQDHRVDILDAFILARRIEGPGPVPGVVLDLNGDGVVDDRDVRALAAQAVRLHAGGRS